MTKAILICLLLFISIEGIAQEPIDSAIERNSRSYSRARLSGNSDSLFSALDSMFTVYFAIGDYSKSFEYAEQLYNISVASGNSRRISGSLISLGLLYAAIDDYPHAIVYYKRALIPDSFNSPHQYSRLLLYIAESYAYMSMFDSSSYYYNKYALQKDIEPQLFQISTGESFLKEGKYLQALKNFQTVAKDPATINDPRIVLDLARVNAVLNDPEPALRYAKMGVQLALAGGANQFVRDGYKIISDAFEQMGKRDSADYYFRKYSVSRDIVFNAQTQGRMAAMTYEQEISRMNHENEIREINLQKQVLVRNSLLGGILLLLLLAFLLSRYLLLKRKDEIRQRLIVENELTIQKLDAEKTNAELERQKTDLEIKALRAQMNPHFIFNCLNSINRFIIGSETAKAADYLTKFARVIRMVLENSGAKMITLEEELRALRLYMDLEALRFEKPFRYEIESTGIDTDELMVPSLILQPFVENSIWHGFQPNQTKQGFIQIKFHLTTDHLHCAILDNGVGFTGNRLQKLENMNPDHQKSFGIKFTAERLRYINGSSPEKPIRMEDLRDELGNINGAGVYLIIPIEYI